ncbi:hypothetical protein ACWKTS_18185 [Bacillus toyonensis]
MTISIAWVRKIKGSEELILVSDSRLSGNATYWDQCSKVLTLPRSDSAIGFAGSTDFAYPLMQQLYLSISSYKRSSDRALDLHDLRGHVLKVFNSLQKSIDFQVEVIKKDLEKTEFIFGGYSWKRKEFSIWRIFYNKGVKSFQYKPATSIGKFNNIIFAGDWAATARKKLIDHLQNKYGKVLQGVDVEGFDMEPFEVVRDLLRSSERSATIGGAPQLVKVYQHMNCRPVGVYWPSKKTGIATLQGRILQDYEDSDFWFFDPDTLLTNRIGK